MRGNDNDITFREYASTHYNIIETVAIDGYEYRCGGGFDDRADSCWYMQII